MTNLGIAPILGAVSSNSLYKKKQPHYYFKNYQSVVPHTVHLHVLLEPWLVIYPDAICHPSFLFQMPTTLPVGSRNVQRQLGVAPLPDPSTLAPWLSKMSISSFR